MAQGPIDPSVPDSTPQAPKAPPADAVGRVELHSRYTNLDRHIFACECGLETELLVARKE
jgi:hypothetical protein